MLLFIASVIIAFVAGEYIVRTFFPSRSWIERTFPVEVVRKPLPYVMFGGMPNAKNAKGHELNSKGYRGKYPQATKRPGEYRIFILGGSTIFLGIPSIPALLEEEFRKNNFKNIEVYNFGVVSSGSGQELARIVYEISDLSPDLVIMYGGGNDIIHPLYLDPRPGYPFNFIVYEANPFLKGSADSYSVVSLLAYKSAIFRYLFPSYFVDKFIPIKELRKEIGFLSPQWRESISKTYVGNIIKAHTISKAFGSDFIVFFQPLVHFKDKLTSEEQKLIVGSNFVDTPFILDIREKIRSGFQQAKQNTAYKTLKVVDLSNVYDHMPETVFKDFIHTVQEAKPIVVREMYKHIVEQCDLKAARYK